MEKVAQEQQGSCTHAAGLHRDETNCLCSMASPLISDAGGAWRDAVSVVRTTQTALRAQGISSKSRVLVCDHSHYDLAVVLLALVSIGAAIGILDVGSPPAFVARAAELHRSNVYIGKRTACANELQYLGDSHDIALRCSQRDSRPCGTTASIVSSTESVEWFERSDALTLWTSGTTGTPNGIVRPGPAILSNIEDTCRLMRYSSFDVFLPLLPLTHQYGFSLLLIWWRTRTRLIVGNHRRPYDAIIRAKALCPTVVDATPPQFASLLSTYLNPAFRDAVKHVRMWCTGGSPLPKALASQWYDTAGRQLLDGYGSTELGNISLATITRPNALGSPLANTEISLQKLDPHTQLGEVLVRTDQHTSYLLDSGAPLEVDSDGWYHTGDMGFKEDDGSLRVVGRHNAVHRGGFTIFPAAIELKLSVAGIPALITTESDDRVAGTYLAAFVEQKLSLSREEWSATAREILAEYEFPNHVYLISEIPLLPNGKPDYEKLRSFSLALQSKVKIAKRPSPDQQDILSVDDSQHVCD